MADYGAQAAQVYDPQLQSEQATAGAAHTNTLAALKNEDANIDPSYNAVFKTLATARAGEAAKTDFNYSTALSGQASGLHDNETRLQGNDYLDRVGGVASEQARAHTTVGSKLAAENNSYSALSSALASKYAGLKSAYIQDQLNKEADYQKQIQMENMKQAGAERIASMNRPPSPTGTADQFNNELGDLENTLRNYQAAGYKGDLGAFANKGAIKNKLVDYYKGAVSPDEVNKRVEAIYSKHYIG